MANPIKILAIDGGGIRGIISAMVLAEIERITGKRIADLFDLFGGTSSGAIIALGLITPDQQGNPKYYAQELVAFFEREGKRIFDNPPWKTIRSLGGLIDEKYVSDGLEAVLEQYFGTARLKDTLKDVIVTSYELEQRFPFFFKSRVAKQKPDYDFPIKKVLQASSVAPTYFEPLKLETGTGNQYYALIDGGVFANNPAMCTFAEAKYMYPQKEDFLLVSLGVGQMTRPIPYDDAKDWGQAQWIRPILGVIYDGVSDTVDFQLQQFLSKEQYYRLQIDLKEGKDDLDDVSKTNLRVLKLVAEDLIRNNRPKIEELCEKLTSR